MGNKQKQKNEIYNKNKILGLLDPISRFLINKVIGYSRLSKNTRLTICLQALTLKDDVSEIKREYITKKVTMSICVFLLTILFSLLIDGGDSRRIILILGSIAGVGIYMVMDERLYQRMEKRKEQLIIDYPRIISKIILQNEAGISTYEAIRRMIADYSRNGSDRRYVFEELKLVIKKIENNEPVGEAYIRFGQRCRLHCYIKLGTLLSQHIKKGNKELARQLQEEVAFAYEERKALVLKKAEKAETKLLLPMGMILIIIIVIIIVPVFMTINM